MIILVRSFVSDCACEGIVVGLAVSSAQVEHHKLESGLVTSSSAEKVGKLRALRSKEREHFISLISTHVSLLRFGHASHCVNGIRINASEEMVLRSKESCIS